MREFAGQIPHHQPEHPATERRGEVLPQMALTFMTSNPGREVPEMNDALPVSARTSDWMAKAAQAKSPQTWVGT